MQKILALAVAILLVGCVTVVDDTSKEKKNYTLDLPKAPANGVQPPPAIGGGNASGSGASPLDLLALIAQSGKNSSQQPNLSQYAAILQAMRQFGNNSSASPISPEMLEAFAKMAKGNQSPGAAGADWQKLLNMTKR